MLCVVAGLEMYVKRERKLNDEEMGFLITLYKQAANKREEVKIISDLFLIPENYVMRLLDLKDRDIEKRTVRRFRRFSREH